MVIRLFVIWLTIRILFIGLWMLPLRDGVGRMKMVNSSITIMNKVNKVVNRFMLILRLLFLTKTRKCLDSQA